MNILCKIAEELVTLRTESDSLHMRAAGLFCQAQEDKRQLKAGYGNFRNFCGATGWHFTTVYSLMGCYRNPLLREAYPVIGQLKAITLLKSGLQGPELGQMIEYAKEHTDKELKQAVKAYKGQEAGEPQPGPEQQEQELAPEPESIEDLQDTEAELLAEKQELMDRLREIEAELERLHVRAARLLDA